MVRLQNNIIFAGTASNRNVYLQFPYFTKELEECETLYDKLIYTLKNIQHWNRMPDALKEQVFNRLNELAAVANLSLEDRIAYDKALDRYRVSRIVEEDAREAGWKKGIEEGRAKGIAEGRAEGIAEGRAEGRAEGITEGITRGITEERIRNARTMKEIGIPMEQIVKVTGLTETEIEEL